MAYQGPPPPPPQPPSGRKVGIVEGWEMRQVEKKQANSGAFKGLVFVIGLLAIIVVGGWLVARPIIGPAVANAFVENPGLVRVPVLADVLAAEFADRVNTPAGDSTEEVRFIVEPGQSVDEIRQNLVASGLVTDEEAFIYELARDKKDQLLQSGQFTMTEQFTPVQVATKLTNPDPPVELMTFAFRAGWRLEQIVAYLQQEKEDRGLDFSVDKFRDLALEPPKRILSDYDMLRKIPDGKSLEGFLAGGVYEVPVDVRPEELLRRILDNWQATNGDLIERAENRNIDFYEALRIAALVERETPLDKERKRVAGVYWNRIDPKVNGPTAGLMQADPTVVYASDTQRLADRPLRQWDDYLFWDTLGVDLNTVTVPNRLSSFQTYRNTGLPDWPITTPSRKSIEAALAPDKKKKFLFFVSCPGEDKHTFSKTIQQHRKNVRKCGLPT